MAADTAHAHGNVAADTAEAADTAADTAADATADATALSVRLHSLSISDGVRRPLQAFSPAALATPSLALPSASASAPASASAVVAAAIARYDCTGPQSPLRLSPSVQGTITTDAALAVMTANDILCHSLQVSEGELVGSSVLPILDPLYRHKYERLLARRAALHTQHDAQLLAAGSASASASASGSGVASEPASAGAAFSSDTELVSGSVVRLLRKDGSSYPAALWLKEKTTLALVRIYIWVFEEIDEMQAEFMVSDAEGKIIEAHGDVFSIFGYETAELLKHSFTVLIPSLSHASGKLDLDQIRQLKFFGGRSKRGLTFPVITRVAAADIDTRPFVAPADCQIATSLGGAHGDLPAGSTDVAAQLSAPHPSQQTIQVISMAHIAGVVTLFEHGRIHSINNAFAKYLFGRQAADLVGIASITDLLPDFWIVFDLLGDSGSPASPTMHPVASPLDSDSSSPVALSPQRPAASDAVTALPGGIYIAASAAAAAASRRFSSVSSIASTVSPYRMHLAIPSFVSTNSSSRLSSISAPLDRMRESPELVQEVASVAQASTTKDRLPLSPPQLHSRYVSSPSAASADEASVPASTPAGSATITNGSSALHGPTESDPAASIDEVCLPNADASAIQRSATPVFSAPLTPAPTPTPPPKALAPPTSIDDFEITKSLGEGAYGYVRVGHRKEDPKQTSHVIKYVVKSRVLSWCRRESLGGRIPVEVAILHKLAETPHPNIVDMAYFFQDEFYVYLIMKQTGSIDLFEFIEATPTLSERLVRHLFTQVVLAVCHLHDNGIVHRDIKDENIVVDEVTHAVTLIDFGSSAFLDKGKTFSTFYGTIDFAAPEVLEGNPYDGRPQDMWALGILLYTLIYRENPFYSVDEILGDTGLRIPFVLSEESLDLVQLLLSKDATKRPTVHQVLEHPWFRKSIPEQ
ncbi:hypothetical protein BC831DRAFT_503021 [Entophlyctis helioformis]|nr:hypothetical protein BC831DRAFT_503021 [Entophlyctis helioformis]